MAEVVAEVVRIPRSPATNGASLSRSIMRHLFLFFTGLLALVPAVLAEDSIVFNQRYKSGNRYHQTITTEQQIDMDLGVKKTQQEMVMSLGMLAEVTDSETEFGKRVKVSYDSATISQTVDGQKFAFDSKSPDAANSGPLAAFGGIIGREFTIVFDKEDNVREVENFEATMQKLAAGNPASAALYTQLFNKNTMKHMLEQSALRSPPGKPVLKGNAWDFSNELEMPGIGKLVVRGYYTYQGMVEQGGKRLAKVDAKADIQVETGKDEGNKAGNLINQMNMKIEEGHMEGTLLYDTEINFTRDVQISQTITLTAVIPDGSRRTIRLPMKQKVHMVLDDFGPLKK